MQGKELRTIRQELGLSLRELAAALGYADSAVRRLRQWEREGCGEGIGRKVRALRAAKQPTATVLRSDTRTAEVIERDGPAPETQLG
jgi:transcriptional regulator with XRE-family HTH domain